MSNIYVSPSGSDSNNGSQNAPLRTIQAASQLAQPGSTVYVAPGDYAGDILTTANGTADAPINFISTTPFGAVITGDGLNATTNALVAGGWWNEGNYVNIQGFDIDGSGSNNWTVGFYDSGSSDLFQGNEVHDILTNATAFANVTASGQGGAGAEMDGYAGGINDNMIGNVIYNIGPAGETSSLVQGLYETAPGNVENNVIYNVAGLGVSLWHGAKEINILNNTIDNARDGGILVGSGDSGSDSTTGDYVTVENNIVANSFGGIYEEGITGVHNKYTDNLLYNDTIGGYQYISLQNGLTATGTLFSDPQFVNETMHDYSLQAGSPAIGAGSNYDAPVTDINGNLRPQGSVDIGAYQFMGTLVTKATFVTTGSGSDTLVLSMSEDAWANGDGTSDANGDAAFTISVDGTQLAGTFYATASHAAGAGQAFTFNGNWGPGAHTVTVNFLNDGYGGTPTTDRNLYVNSITYDGVNTYQSALLMNSGAQNFTVTDTTPLPPAVIGVGTDRLVVNVSEDYYKGNAQFTVSIDGKQLGGTLTATVSHSSGGSQNFVFAGDFGAGQHTLSVAFINDLYGGTASTDRNLYVNDIIYNGTDTKQSAALKTNRARSFKENGGTTPSVSETSDHGSLTKNLSQFGTYTIGSDTFVLANGSAATVTLGTGTATIAFIGASAVQLTGGTGTATVKADTGNNSFTAGGGSLDVTGGGGVNTYVFHATSGLLTIEDFSVALSDKLVLDKSLQGSMKQVTDGTGGTLLTFGAGSGHAIDIRGLATMSGGSITWQ